MWRTGGITLSHSSLHAAVMGAAYAAPLVVCSAMSRTRPAKTSFPVLDELHTSQREMLAPIISGAATHLHHGIAVVAQQAAANVEDSGKDGTMLQAPCKCMPFHSANLT